MEQMNFWKTDQSDRFNGQFLLSFIFSCITSCSCYQLLTPGNFQSTLTEGDHRRLPVTLHSIFSSCQSKQLDSLGTARWQTVFLLSSMLRLITTMAVLWVSSLLIVLLVMAAIFVAVHTKTMDGRSKASFHFQSCLPWVPIELVS